MPELQAYILFGIFIGALAVVALGAILWTQLSKTRTKRKGRQLFWGE